MERREHPAYAEGHEAGRRIGLRHGMREAARLARLAAERWRNYGLQSKNVEKQSAGIIAWDALNSFASFLATLAEDTWWFEKVPFGDDDPTEPLGPRAQPIDTESTPGRSKTLRGAGGVPEGIGLHQGHTGDSRKDELSDAITGLHRQRANGEVEQDRVNLAPEVRVDRSKVPEHAGFRRKS